MHDTQRRRHLAPEMHEDYATQGPPYVIRVYGFRFSLNALRKARTCSKKSAALPKRNRGPFHRHGAASIKGKMFAPVADKRFTQLRLIFESMLKNHDYITDMYITPFVLIDIRIILSLLNTICTTFMNYNGGYLYCICINCTIVNVRKMH